MSDPDQNLTPDPNDPELVMLERILHKTRDFIFPLSESEITATDADVERLMERIKPRLLIFREKILAIAASLFYMAGGGFIYAVMRQSSRQAQALAGSSTYNLPDSFLGHSAKVVMECRSEPPVWPYILSGVLLATATLLLLGTIRSIRSRRRISGSR